LLKVYAFGSAGLASCIARSNPVSASISNCETRPWWLGLSFWERPPGFQPDRLGRWSSVPRPRVTLMTSFPKWLASANSL